MIDCDFPGGNIIVERVDGDDVYLRQDLRDTEGDWFYWCFRVRGPAGRALTFRFTAGNVIGVRGPALSLDGGKTWQWLGADAVQENSFSYAFGPGADDVRFSFGMPYMASDLRTFLERHRGNPALREETLCVTRRGRTVERLHVGRLRGKPEHRVLITCRHHCCEMMASYVLEGLLEQVLHGDDDGAWLRGNVELLVVPFVDKDGVEDGDQGKSRRPRDHGRDYADESIYASTGAIRRLVPAWSEGRLRVALDLHCPHIRGPHNEVIYQVGHPDVCASREQCRFGEILEGAVSGPLPYQTSDDLPFGQAWNTGGNYSGGKGCSRWAAELPGVRLPSSFEVPYANAGGAEVNAETARAFGHDLARALRRYLESTGFRAGAQ